MYLYISFKLMDWKMYYNDVYYDKQQVNSHLSYSNILRYSIT